MGGKRDNSARWVPKRVYCVRVRVLEDDRSTVDGLRSRRRGSCRVTRLDFRSGANKQQLKRDDRPSWTTDDKRNYGPPLQEAGGPSKGARPDQSLE